MTPSQAVKFLKYFQKEVGPHTHVTTVLCAPFVTAPFMLEYREPDVVRIGVQDISRHDEGAYTGDIAATMIKQFAEYVICGHSERRHYHGEREHEIAGKVAAVVRNSMKAILCVGEVLDDKHHGLGKRVVVDQLQAGLSQVTDEDMEQVIIAYEPVWAVGTDMPALPKNVEPMATAIRETIAELFGENIARRVPVLYGGSADISDAQAFLELDDINGLLVGHASLNWQEFAGIVKIAQKLAK